MIKRFSLALLAATAMGVVATQGASAADMGIPTKAPPLAPPPPIWNWTGLYAGGVFGLGISRNQLTSVNSPWDAAIPGNLCEGTAQCTSGGLGLANTALGTQIGVGPQGGFTLDYKWQAPNSPWVWGIGGQFSFADLQGSTNTSQSGSAFFGKFINGGGPSPCFDKFRSCLINASTNSTISSNIRDIATITGLFGITSGPQDRTLWYVKGGAAWNRTKWSEADEINGSFTDFHFSGKVAPFNSFNGQGVGSLGATTNRWGWTVGTGVEWGLWGNWSAKIEYDFLDFGSYSATLTGNGSLAFQTTGCCSGSISGPLSHTIHVQQQIHLVQVGLSYKFDWANWGHY